MLSFRILPLFLLLLPLFASAQSPNYFDLDLRDLSAAQTDFPDWIEEITEQGGNFDAEHGWQIPSKKPFGIGRLYVSIDRAHIAQDIALSFFSENSGNIAVQLYDADERTLAVDLLAARSVFDTALFTSVIIPLSKYPTAKHIVLRRLDGEVSISSLSLVELTEATEQSDAGLAQLATLLGDPLAPENPLIANLRSQTTSEVAEALLSAEPTHTQPLIQLSRLNGTSPLREDELITVLQVLGLQGFEFNANDFVQAAGEGREEVVNLYLRAGMPVNVQGRNRYTAVAEAATSGELRVLKLLCEHGADLEIRTAGGNSALWMACLGNHYEAIRLLVEAGADVNAKGAYGNTPVVTVHQGRSSNYLKADEYIRFLLEHGADPSIANNRGETLVHKVVSYGSDSMLKVVLSYDADVSLKDITGFTPMMVAKYRNSSSMQKTLLAHGAVDWVPEFDSLDDQLVYHIYRGETKEAYELLNQGASPDATDMDGEAIVFKMISSRNLNMIKHFRSRGMNLEVRGLYGRNPLGYINGTYRKEREAMVDYFLEEGLDPNDATTAELKKKKPYWTPLMNAADSGNSVRCQRLLAAGADPTIKNLPARTASMIAERAGHFQLGQELKAAEAEWSSK